MRAALPETTMTCGWNGLGNFSDEESRPAAQILSFRAKQPATTSTFAHEFNRDAPKPRFAWQSRCRASGTSSGRSHWQRHLAMAASRGVGRNGLHKPPVAATRPKSGVEKPDLRSDQETRRFPPLSISQTPPALPSSERAGAYSAHTYLPIIHAPQIPASERNALSRRPMLVSRIPPQPRFEMHGTARLSSLLAYLGWVGHKRARLSYRTVDTSSNLGSKAHDSTLRLMCRHAHCDAMRLKTSILHFPIPHDRVA